MIEDFFTLIIIIIIIQKTTIGYFLLSYWIRSVEVNIVISSKSFTPCQLRDLILLNLFTWIENIVVLQRVFVYCVLITEETLFTEFAFDLCKLDYLFLCQKPGPNYFVWILVAICFSFELTYTVIEVVFELLRSTSTLCSTSF